MLKRLLKLLERRRGHLGAQDAPSFASRFRKDARLRRPHMKAKFTLIAAALLVVSNIASAQERQAPSAGAQEQEAPSAKMTGEEMMGHMGCGTKGHGMMRRGMMPHGMPMRLMMILMDTDGDGALSLEEFQAAHAKIFKGIDANKDGKVTPTEMEIFFSGGSPTGDQ